MKAWERSSHDTLNKYGPDADRTRRSWE